MTFLANWDTPSKPDLEETLAELESLTPDELAAVLADELAI